eukprot:scaffold39834_cov33-Phaeocystis_antarctica.AAC.1
MGTAIGGVPVDDEDSGSAAVQSRPSSTVVSDRYDRYQLITCHAHAHALATHSPRIRHVHAVHMPTHVPCPGTTPTRSATLTIAVLTAITLTITGMIATS